MLQHISQTKCPHCGARMRSQRQEQQHCNGHWNEYRSFDCGLESHFSPNFMRTQEKSPCALTDASKAIVEARQKLLDLVRETVGKGEADELFKKKLLNQLQYVSISV